MILGIGTDMVEIERVKKACEKEAFFLYIYTEEERRQTKGNPVSLAGDFAVKEAVSKVFGTGFRSFLPKDIEVLRDELGKPYVVLYEGARDLFEKRGFQAIHVSITNTADHAFAFAVGEGKEL